MNSKSPISDHPLTYNECGLLLGKVSSLSFTLGAPGDWGYGTKLGDLAIILEDIRLNLVEELSSMDGDKR